MSALNWCRRPAGSQWEDWPGRVSGVQYSAVDLRLSAQPRLQQCTAVSLLQHCSLHSQGCFLFLSSKASFIMVDNIIFSSEDNSSVRAARGSAAPRSLPPPQIRLTHIKHESLMSSQIFPLTLISKVGCGPPVRLDISMFPDFLLMENKHSQSI